MNASWYSRRTVLLMRSRSGSRAVFSGPPPRSSSQLGPVLIAMGRPSIWECGGAVGTSSPSGVSVRLA